jgi:hypothetical protein
MAWLNALRTRTSPNGVRRWFGYSIAEPSTVEKLVTVMCGIFADEDAVDGRDEQRRPVDVPPQERQTSLLVGRKSRYAHASTRGLPFCQ